MVNFGGLRAASELIQRAMFAAKAGISYLGKRDTYEALGYKRLLTVEDYRGRYRRGGLAPRIVEALPNATWRGGAELIEDDDPEVSTPFEEAFKALDERLGIWGYLRRADILAGLGEYAVLFLGTPGDIKQPLPKTIAPEKLTYIAAYAQDEAKISKWEEDAKSERYGFPLEYTIERKGSSIRRTAGLTLKQVHHSRIIHVADAVLDDEVFGFPRLERVWNLLDDLDKVIGSGAEAFWQRVNAGFVFNLDKDLELDQPDVDKLKEQVDEYTHGQRRVLTTRGMELEVLDATVANFLPQADAIVTQIAGATEIPKRILVGSERGELASSQDKTNWDDRVSDRRNEWAHPRVVKPFVDLLIKVGILPEPAEYKTLWPETKKLDDVQTSSVATAWAGLNSKAGDVVVTAAEIRDLVLRLDPLSEDQLAEEEQKQADKQAADLEKMDAQAKIVAKNAPPGKMLPGGPKGPPKPVPKAAAAGGQPSPAAPFRRIHKAADAHRARVARSLEIAVIDAVGAYDEAAVAAALEARNLGAVEALLEPVAARMRETFEGVAVPLTDCLVDAAVATARSASRVGWRAANFDPHQPRDKEGQWTDGHAFSVQGQGSDAAKAKMVEALNALPPAVRDRLKNVRVIIVPTHTSATDGREIAGEYKDNLVTVAERANGHRTRVEHVVLHEMGHAHDWAVKGSSDVFAETFAAESGRLNGGDKILMAHYLKNRRESFAETFANAFSQKGALGKQFLKKFPKSLELMRATL